MESEDPNHRFRKRSRQDLTHDQSDELSTMNPILMTERQQLAFLLRQTAPHKVGESSSDDNTTPEVELKGKGKKNALKSKLPSQNTKREKEKALNKKLKSRVGTHKRSDIPGNSTQGCISSPSTVTTRIQTSEENSECSAGLKEDTMKNHRTLARRSPRSAIEATESSNLIQVVTAKPDENSEDIGCAFCGSSNTVETLFLCRSCDSKYPTQKSLGVF